MRSIEHMAYAIYLADWQAQHDASGPMRTFGANGTPKTWEQLTETEQGTYKRHANAVLQHLFEHGRIASYITTPERLAELCAEYDAYLVSIGEQWLRKEGIL